MPRMDTDIGQMEPKSLYAYKPQSLAGLNGALFWLAVAGLLSFLVWQNPFVAPRHAICVPNQCFALNLLFCGVPLTIGLYRVFNMWSKSKILHQIEITDTSVSAPVQGKSDTFSTLAFADIDRVELSRHGSDLQGKIVIYGPAQKLEILAEQLTDPSKLPHIYKQLQQA